MIKNLKNLQKGSKKFQKKKGKNMNIFLTLIEKLNDFGETEDDVINVLIKKNIQITKYKQKWSSTKRYSQISEK